MGYGYQLRNMSLLQSVTTTPNAPTPIIIPEGSQHAELFQAVEELLDFVRAQGWSEAVIAEKCARLPDILKIEDVDSREGTLAELIFMILMDLVEQGSARMIANINKPEYAGLRGVLRTFSNYLLPLVPASIDSEDIFPSLWPVALDASMLLVVVVLFLQLPSIENVSKEVTFVTLTLICAYVIMLTHDGLMYIKRKEREEEVNRLALKICACVPGTTPARIKSILVPILELLEGAHKEP